MKAKKVKGNKGMLQKLSLAIIVIAIITWIAFVLYSWQKNPLPVLGEPGHTVGNFSFTDQDGKTITDKDVAGKIRVVEYFFTTCKSICPIMNKNLVAVQDAYKDRDDVIILSHTVNPSTDSVAVLKKYADKMHAIPGKWEFLTGSKLALYQMAQQDYLLSADTTTSTNEADAFIHTQYIALVDKENRIRGFYDATNNKEIDKLITDINKL